MVSSCLRRSANSRTTSLNRALGLSPKQARGEGRGLGECRGWVHGDGIVIAGQRLPIVEAGLRREGRKERIKGKKDRKKLEKSL